LHYLPPVSLIPVAICVGDTGATGVNNTSGTGKKPEAKNLVTLSLLMWGGSVSVEIFLKIMLGSKKNSHHFYSSIKSTFI
jgi:hypothetical protein